MAIKVPKTIRELNLASQRSEDSRLDRKAAMIVNDLDSLVHRIEGLQAHPRYTDALIAVQSAKQAITDGRSDIHQTNMRERFKYG